jgi:WHEP-TRS domain
MRAEVILFFSSFLQLSCVKGEQISKAICGILNTQDAQLPKMLAFIVIDDPTIYQTLKSLEIDGSMTVNIAEELVGILGWAETAAIIGINNMGPELFLEKKARLQAKKEELSAMLDKQQKAVDAAVKLLIGLKDEYKAVIASICNEKVILQDDTVRNLKAQKAAKLDIDAAAKLIMDLKAEFKKTTGKEWKRVESSTSDKERRTYGKNR